MSARAIRRLVVLTTLFAGLALSACSIPTAPPSPPPPLALSTAVSEAAPVVLDDDGTPRTLAARVCRPAAQRGPAPLVIINHGAPPLADYVPLMEPTSCNSEPARWFTARGYVVVFALRRGFGASGGDIAEASGSCEAPDYVRNGQQGARDVDAILRWAERLPDVRRDATLVVGLSTGGWASLAYASRPDARAIGVIDMAGGRNMAGRGAFTDLGSAPCHPDRLVAAAGRFGATARIPTLWIYASNDNYFPPDLATAMHAAFTKAGGWARLVITPPFGTEGHALFYGAGGSAIWGPIVERFLAPPGS
jgi:dienelactone hydrolase